MNLLHALLLTHQVYVCISGICVQRLCRHPKKCLHLLKLNLTTTKTSCSSILNTCRFKTPFYDLVTFFYFFVNCYFMTMCAHTAFLNIYNISKKLHAWHISSYKNTNKLQICSKLNTYYIFVNLECPGRFHLKSFALQLHNNVSSYSNLSEVLSFSSYRKNRKNVPI